MSLGYPARPDLLYFAIVGFAAAAAAGLYLWRDSRRRGIDVWWVSFTATLGPIAAAAGAVLAIAELFGSPLLVGPGQIETITALLWLSVIAGAAMLVSAMVYSSSADRMAGGGDGDGWGDDGIDDGATTILTPQVHDDGSATPMPGGAAGIPQMGGAGVNETLVIRPEGAVDGTIAWLTVLTYPRQGQEIALSKDAVIGRDGQACHIVLDDDRVSGLHARIQHGDDDLFVLRDLGSSNGTFVNGERVDVHQLQDHDTIRVGDTELEFFWVRQAADVPSDRAYRGSLLLQTGPRRGDAVPVNQDKLLLGASAVCDVQLSDAGVATVHAVITRDGESYILSGSGDANVLVNGESVEQRTLADRDEIVLGEARLIFRDGQDS